MNPTDRSAVSSEILGGVALMWKEKYESFHVGKKEIVAAATHLVGSIHGMVCTAVL